ncbi:putative F-box/FBD/LRR-repeat protein [Vitis vinifera]|uniref:Putative F-box/FBD/LRR-repeat protein n=1 Tax=Vitis vinifera TaxID=29760 RepID=A0A438CUC8_VITVI|nr:putative F-box/FBD/LRR-repeat protein [Vitis vinifera]RVW69651.1 putative F-box/FBD/LRR-repeat protein [Vitis vinifera]
METRSSKRKRLLQAQSESHTDIDRITHLPDAVLHQILLLLPIKTIAQTSVLSKRWRLLWSSFPDLDFTTLNPHCMSCYYFDSCGGRSSVSPNPNTLDCISQTLAARQRGSDIRVLRFRAHLGFSRLNGLIRSAIRHNVQDLDIDVCTDDYFNLPRCVVISESLKALSLKFRPPGFRLPPSMVMKGGFQSLQTLSLSHMVFYKKHYLLDLFAGSAFPVLRKLTLDSCCGIKFLDVGCRALQDLTVENCFQLHGLTVSGPRLERLRVVSCFESSSEKSWVKIIAPRLRVMHWEHNAITETSCLENLASMEEAFIGFFALDEDTRAEKYKSVSNILSGLSHAHCLTLQSQCIQNEVWNEVKEKAMHGGERKSGD